MVSGIFVGATPIVLTNKVVSLTNSVSAVTFPPQTQPNLD